MSALAPEHAALLPFLPESAVGAVQSITPIRAGLSGAGVYAVAAARGAFVLRMQPRELDEGYFAQQLRVLRRAAEAHVAPAIVHVDERARAVVSVRVPGMPLPGALANPAQRPLALASVVDQLRALHSLDATYVAVRDPIPYTRTAWDAGRARPGFPPWAMSLGSFIDEIQDILAKDPRRVVSHNDVNPGNILWDGTRVWLVDWEVTGLGHPYFDLATFAMFLRLDDAAGLDLAARHDRAPLNDTSRAAFHALRRLSGMLCGLTFLGLVPDLTVRTAPTLADAPSLSDIYAAMRTGELDLQSAYGQVSFGLALLATGVSRQMS